MDNYLAAEAPTLERLKDAVQLVPDNKVFSVEDLAGIKEKQQVTPALHLLYAGDKFAVSDSNEDGAFLPVQQLWMVVVAVKNLKGSSEARQEAGLIIPEVIDALVNWQPADGYTPYVRIPGPSPGYSKGGFAYFPLLFSTTLVTGA